MTKPTTIYEDNQAALNNMATGHITSRVKHMTVPADIIHENNRDIKNGNAKVKKISGKLNPADIGTQLRPISSLHRLSRQLHRQRHYPAPDSKHCRLMQVKPVN